MKKSRGYIVLLCTILFLALGAYTAVFGLDADRTGSAANIKQGLDLAGGVSITYQVVGDNPSSEDMADTIYKLQKRVEKESTEAQVYPEGSNRINIEIPGVTDANEILEKLGKPGSLQFVKMDGTVVIEGTQVESAQAGQSTDNMGNKEFVVSLTLNDAGKVAFADATTELAGKGVPLYIVYDEEIISAPTVNEPITGGQAYITGMADFKEAENLAQQIRIGGLKLELEELRSNVVGAQLGEEAVNTSLQAGIIGLIIVILFMIFVYFISGVSSALALLVYTILMALSLNAFNLTLTLPGIAGIILSIGMAVDANVIIFARIKEEIARGISVETSIKTGFQKAFSAIFDGNITTLIAAAVLGIMGTGAIKGFAATLALGIVISMFTALVVTRRIMYAFFAIGLKDKKFYGKAKEAKTRDFLAPKNIFFVISIVAVIVGFVFMGVNKSQTGEILNYSLEFMGGTSTNITFNENLSIEDIDTKVVPIVEGVTDDGAIQTQKVQGTNEVIIKTRMLSVDEREELNQLMIDEFSVDKEKIVAETIGSTISSEMRMDAIIAVLVATFCMLIYIWFRFKDIRFATSAVVALVHDVLIVLAFYAIAKISIGSTFIACMLTIVGYSINATIVIFDRIRENIQTKTKNEDLKSIVNKSISQTFSRSVFTSLTTFIMVAVLYVMGVTSIKEFALPLMVGIICGTYSSVCLTGALWYVLRSKFVKKTNE